MAVAVRSGRSGGGGSTFRNFFSYRVFASAMFTLLFIVTLFVLFSSHPSHHDHNNRNAYIHRSVLGLRSDPIKTRLDLVYKQANDHIELVNAYAAYARKLKLDISKQLKMFEDLAKNFSDLQSKPTYRTALFDTDLPMDEDSLRQFEKEVKDKVKFARLLISDSKDLMTIS